MNDERARRTHNEVHGFVGRYPDFMIEGYPPCSTTDPEIYFPDKGNAGQGLAEIKMAKRICNSCPYKIECLSWAVANDEIGIWGGTTQKERRVLRRQRRLAS